LQPTSKDVEATCSKSGRTIPYYLKSQNPSTLGNQMLVNSGLQVGILNKSDPNIDPRCQFSGYRTKLRKRLSDPICPIRNQEIRYRPTVQGLDLRQDSLVLSISCVKQKIER
jgi:hypothetical protein